MKKLLVFDISATTGWALFEYDATTYKRLKGGVIDVSKLTTPQIKIKLSKPKKTKSGNITEYSLKPVFTQQERGIEMRKQLRKLIDRYKPDTIAREALLIPKGKNSSVGIFTMVQLNVIADDTFALYDIKPILIEGQDWKDIFAVNGIPINKSKKEKEKSIQLSQKLGMSCEIETKRGTKLSDDAADANLIGVYLIEKGQGKW